MRAPRGAASRTRVAGGSDRTEARSPWLSSSCRQQRPQLVGAARRHAGAELGRPIALAAEIVTPGPQPAREPVQHVFLREADGAVQLVRNCCALLGGLAHTDLCR